MRSPLKLSYANIVASLALFIALGGASYAALKIPKNSVGTTQLRANAVNGAKVKPDSLTDADINLSSLGTVPSANVANSANAASIANRANTANFATTAASAASAATADNGIETIGLDIPNETNETILEFAPGLIQLECGGEGKLRFRNESGSGARIWVDSEKGFDESRIASPGVYSTLVETDDHIEIAIRTDDHIAIIDIYSQQNFTPECGIAATVILRSR
jgi:hypothetical protein